jgi:hypothetical protein
VDHVHRAGEAELADAIGKQLDRGVLEGWQSSADSQVREDDPAGAITRLLPVERDLQRHALNGLDPGRRVSTTKNDRHPLDVLDDLGAAGGRSAAEEEPHQTRRGQHDDADDDQVCGVHELCPFTVSDGCCGRRRARVSYQFR